MMCTTHNLNLVAITDEGGRWFHEEHRRRRHWIVEFGGMLPVVWMEINCKRA